MANMSAISAHPPSTAKPRSCAACRLRKVRCDKLAPCSNCQRGGIPCEVQPQDSKPRWARQFERKQQRLATTPRSHQQPGGDVVARLQHLEALVSRLGSQQEPASIVSSFGSRVDDKDRASEISSSAASSSGLGVTGFWDQINDEIKDLKLNSEPRTTEEPDTSEDEDEGENDTEDYSSPLDRHVLLFPHTVGVPTKIAHPPAEQVPLLVDAFLENMNIFIQVIHAPAVRSMAQKLCEPETAKMSPANEALMFSIYYAAIVSMDEQDVMAKFKAPRMHLANHFRNGLESALARADFINKTSLITLQAYLIFLFIVRIVDSPRFVWMMTGLAIRMAQALGLHKDGSHDPALSPYQVELRRRLWWAVCALDIRTSESEGVEFSVARNTFDTKRPANLNDVDFHPDMKEIPQDASSVTDAMPAVLHAEFCEFTYQLRGAAHRHVHRLEEQERLVRGFYEKFVTNSWWEQGSSSTDNIMYWVGEICVRLVMSKTILFIFLPHLSSGALDVAKSEEVRNRALVAAIEVAEYNDALFSKPEAAKWKWMYLSFTHWNAIVYMLIELTRRPFSATMERAWLALQSPWLIPNRVRMEKTSNIWVPLRKLINKARRHRHDEINRFRRNITAILEVEALDEKIPTPESPGRYSGGKGDYHHHWRSIIGNMALEGGLSVPSHSQSHSPKSNAQRSYLDSYQNSYQSSPSSHEVLPQLANLTGPAPTELLFGDGGLHPAGQDIYSSEYMASYLGSVPYNDDKSMFDNLEMAEDGDWQRWIDSMVSIERISNQHSGFE